MRDLLRHRDFRLLFAGQSLSMFGDMAMLIVLAMWAKELTGSNGVAGSVFAALVLPSLLAPLGGVLIDRFRRRTVMIVTDLATAAVVLLLLLVDGRGDLWLLYVVAFLYGASLVAFSSARSALLSTMLEDAPARAGERLAEHRARGAAAGRARSPAPPCTPGSAAPAVAVVDAATFLVSAAALLALRVDEPEPVRVRPALPGRGQRRRPAPARQPGAARHRRRHRHLHARHRHQRVGVLRGRRPGPGQAGEFVGVLGRDPGRRRDPGRGHHHGADPPHRRAAPGPLVVRRDRASGSCCSTSSQLPVVAAGTLLFGAGLPVLIVCLTTVIQRRTPGELQGRMFTAFELFTGVPQLLSILGGAVAVSLVDFRILLVVMALGIAAAAVYSALRLREDSPAQSLDGSDLSSVLADPAVVDLEVPVGAHLLQQPTVVADEQQRPVVASIAPPRAARSRPGRGGWSARRARGGWPAGPSAAPGRPGCARPATGSPTGRSTSSAPRPNFASRVRASASS